MSLITIFIPLLLGLCTGTRYYRKDRCVVAIWNQTICTYIYRCFVPVLHSLNMHKIWYVQLYVSHKYAKCVVISKLECSWWRFRDGGCHFVWLLIICTSVSYTSCMSFLYIKVSVSVLLRYRYRLQGISIEKKLKVHSPNSLLPLIHIMLTLLVSLLVCD